MWTPSALASEARPFRGEAWRVVEAQHEVATRRITASAADQELLEDILEETKPPYPEACDHLDYMLKTPFRYAPPSPHGSRFRRAHAPHGVFYGSAYLATAMSEVAFYRLLFFEAMDTPVYPREATSLTAFTAAYSVRTGIDLTRPPLNRDAADWTDPVRYAATQALADVAREAGVQALRYRSVRDPKRGMNVALLTCAAFSKPAPVKRQTWHLLVRRHEVAAWRSSDPRERLSFARTLFELEGELRRPG